MRKIFLLATFICLQVSLYPQKSLNNTAAGLNGLPISFEENHGQVDSNVRFLAHAGKSVIYFTPNEAVLALYSRDSQKKPAVSALRMQWIGANAHPEMIAEHPLPGRINYLIGRDPANWHTNLPTYGQVRYRDLFPGVDAVFFGKDGEIEYDMVLSPGSDLGKISFGLEGVQSMRLADNGDLVLKLANGEVRHRRPMVYQENDGERRWLSAHYVIHNNKTIGYEVAGVNHKLPLVIDPTLSYSTYLGSDTPDSVSSVAVDQFGQAYITGSTVFGFPTKNPAQGNQLGTDAFVTKLSANGGSLIYSTILGGSSSDTGNAIAIDRFGNAYVAGETSSTDFPTTPGAFQSPQADADNGFVTKLSPSGSSFVYSLLLGGGDSDTILSMALDTEHRVYVTGFTCSLNFPVKNAFQPVTNSQNCADGGGDTFVTRINATGTDLDYSTYLDGTLASIGNGIAVDSTFHAYVTGSTESPDFPTTSGAFQTTFLAKTIPSFPHDISGHNAYITKFAPDGLSLVYSTFLGGTVSDAAAAIALDSDGRAYVTGTTQSADFPVTSGAFQKSLHGTVDAFVTKMQISGGGLFYSTFLGGSDVDGGSSVAVDSLGRAYVTGGTSSADFPVLNPIQAHFGGSQDAFVTKLSATGNALFYSTYLGGAAADSANSIRLDSNANAYVGGVTSSTNFPTTPGAFSRTKKQGSDGWVAKIAP
ncbi:MAG TPA: SBBP repeat-containing protein [Candidatus Angelobacter sp.]|nr:SBBP repeat-containing protein [Candidatus Angelobacter sp.]